MGDEAAPAAAEEEETFAFAYGPDWPEAISDMGSVMLGGRPTNHTLGPTQQMNILISAAPYRAPTPRRAGKGKPLPATEYEGEMETEMRKKTQKLVQRLILPKVEGESADVFLRRMDAHNNTPEVLIAPKAPNEDEPMFIKRCIAVKETSEMPDHLILPKGVKENAAEFEERLAIAKKTPTLVFPRGHFETTADFKARLQICKQAKPVVMPKSEKETGTAYHKRLDVVQGGYKYVVHPYDPAREDDPAYNRRLKAMVDAYNVIFEPGDKKAVEEVIGAEHVHKELSAEKPVVDVSDVSEPSVGEKVDAAVKKREAEEAKAAEEAAARATEAEEKAAEEAKVQEALARQKEEQEKARAEKEAKELEEASTFGFEKIAINKIGFMPLKKLMMERGCDQKEVFACANKFALMELAKKKGSELKIEWTEE